MIERKAEVARKFSQLNVVLLGPPGSGKSSLIEKIGQHTDIKYICLGGLTRIELEKDTELSKELGKLFETSEPWPDNFVLSIVEPHVLEARDTGFVLDGIPKKESEARVLSGWANGNSVNFDLILVLDVEENVAFDRIGGRSRHGRLERKAHYQARFAKWNEDRDLMIKTLNRNAKVLEVDTSNISEDDVLYIVFNYIAMNFMGS